ncbi:MAG: heavy metal-binding domain-containing protein [Candidatus Diapherotrites archaeon]
MPEEKTEKEKGVHIVSTPFVPRHKITEVKGLVWASTVRSKFFLDDLKAWARMLAGGEVKEYRELLNEARRDILKKLNDNAKELNANAVISVVLNTAPIVPGTVEILAYGTAVIFEREYSK